jgi:hypothetical protein
MSTTTAIVSSLSPSSLKSVPSRPVFDSLARYVSQRPSMTNGVFASTACLVLLGLNFLLPPPPPPRPRSKQLARRLVQKRRKSCARRR